MNSLGKFAIRRLCQNKHTIDITSCREFKRHVSPYLKRIGAIKRSQGERPPVRRSNFLEWNYKAELFAFGKRVREEFDDQLLRRALTERSYIEKKEREEKRLGIPPLSEEEKLDNSPMATKGEEIIENFALLYLRNVLPKFPEEGIQSIKTHLLSEETLAHVSFHIGTSELILCKGFPVSKPILQNVLKALVTAVYDSSGLERTSLFIRDFIITQIAEIDINDFWPIDDPIDVLKTICRNEGVSEPEPRLIGQAGVNTILAVYRVGYYVDKKLIGIGPGETVKIAQEMAACDALRRLFGTAQHQLSIPFDLVLDPYVESLPNVRVQDWCEKNVLSHLERVRSMRPQLEQKESVRG